MDTTLNAHTGISKSEYAYRILRENIITGAYPPGTVLYIREISEKLNISRTPVKDAITRLAHDGVVDIFPERYAIVAKIDYIEMIEHLELRECVESTAAFYAAQRRTQADIDNINKIFKDHSLAPFEDTSLISSFDQQLHMAIARASYNRQLIQTLENFFYRCGRANYFNQKLPLRYQNTLGQHRAIITAIEEGNPEAARQAMSEHIQDILTTIKVYQYQNSHLFK